MENEFVNYTKFFLKSRIGSKISNYIKSQRKKTNVFPSSKDIFLPITILPPEKVKMVIIGQDPYPSEHAMGIAFSSRKENTPDTLKKIFENLKKHLFYYNDIEPFQSNNLIPWVKRGILLINTYWTTNNKPNGHSNIGWENYTKGIIDILNKRRKPVPFVLMGKEASQLEPFIKGEAFKCPHPSIEKYRPMEFINHDFINPVFDFIKNHNLWETERIFIDLEKPESEKQMMDIIRKRLIEEKYPVEGLDLEFDNVKEDLALRHDTFGIYFQRTINLIL